MAFIRKESPMSVPSLEIGGADGVTGFAFKNTIIINSGVMTIGDVVSVLVTSTAGNLVTVQRYGTAGETCLGVCIGFGQASGLAVAFDAGTNNRVTVGATNQTVAQIYAIIDSTPGAVWSAPLTGTIDTTQTAGFGTFFDPNTGANAGAVLESSATRTSTTGRALTCVGKDPDAPTTRVLVILTETFFMVPSIAS
jgi:hypothetical protein